MICTPRLVRPSAPVRVFCGRHGVLGIAHGRRRAVAETPQAARRGPETVHLRVYHLHAEVVGAAHHRSVHGADGLTRGLRRGRRKRNAASVALPRPGALPGVIAAGEPVREGGRARRVFEAVRIGQAVVGCPQAARRGTETIHCRAERLNAEAVAPAHNWASGLGFRQ